MKVPDIYFEEYWGVLNAEQDGGTYCSYAYEDENGYILHRFIKRPTSIIDGTFDILSPTGFSGPVILNVRKGREIDLIRSYDKDFQNYCDSNGIVAEYIRFSPWINNQQDFKDIYELKHHARTIGIDLQNDFFDLEFTSQTRRVVRRAEKGGVQIEFDFNCETITEFYQLYTDMFVKKVKEGADNFDIFSERYIRDVATQCKGHIFLINALVDNKMISSQMCLYSDNFLHGYLCGSDPDFSKYNAHSLITYKACEWGKNNHKTTYHLGAARTEGIYNYKKHFTRKGVFDFYVGYKIRSTDLYNQLIVLKGNINDSYFPAYRG